MVGIGTERKELVYHKTSKTNITLNLYSVNGKRDYTNYKDTKGNELITNDKLFLLEIVGSDGNVSALYPFYTYDIAECAFNVIKNKVIPIARKNEADKILKRINEALSD